MFVKTLVIVVYSRKAAVSFWQTLLALGTDMSFTLSAVEYSGNSEFFCGGSLMNKLPTIHRFNDAEADMSSASSCRDVARNCHRLIFIAVAHSPPLELLRLRSKISSLRSILPEIYSACNVKYKFPVKLLPFQKGHFGMQP